MAQEYIDRKPLLQYLKETVPDNDWLVSQFNADWIYSFIESPLAADVVPKAEVERLQRILDSYALQYGTVKDQHEVIDQIKRAIARDIVMDAKTKLLDYHSQEDEKYSKSRSKTKKQFDIQTERYRAITDAIKFAIETLTGIEKKYTEDSTDGKRTDH
jgi:hypothetical protein